MAQQKKNITLKSKNNSNKVDDLISSDRYAAYRKPRVSLPLYAVSLLVVLGVGITIGGNSNIYGNLSNTLFGTHISGSAGTLDLSTLQDTYAKLKNSFDGPIDDSKLIDGAEHGMVAALGDPYTVYFNKAEATSFSSGLTGTFSGVGMELGKRDSVLTVISTLDNSPAKKAGVQAGDKIAVIDGQDASTLAVDAAVSKIRGEKGTSVKISVLRGDQKLDFTITRDEITDPSVKSEVVGNTGIMRISRFGADTAGAARDVARQFVAQGIKSVILDLRGNGGGYVDAAQGVASLWLDDKVVVTERDGDKIVKTVRSDSNPILGGVKTIVLIDGGSASASEIVAGALKDNGAATLMGSKSYGKGSVQSVSEFTDGSELKVTIAKWYTPTGKNIDKSGITPDKIVDPSQADIAAGNDVARQNALDLLK